MHLKVGIIKYKLLNVSNIEFQQNLWKGLFSTEESSFLALCILTLLWINMNENQNSITIYDASSPYWISITFVEWLMEYRETHILAIYKLGFVMDRYG